MGRVILKDGSSVVVTPYTSDDFEQLVEMYASLSKETLRWAVPPYTRDVIERWTQNHEKKIILVAHLQNKIVGHCHLNTSQKSRYKGQSTLLTYIHQDFQNKGLGTTMISTTIQQARERGLHRISLTVVVDNTQAVHVYEKVGFQREGILKDAYYGEDQRYHDKIAMGLLL